MPFLPLEHPEALAAIGALLPNGTRAFVGWAAAEEARFRPWRTRGL